MRPVFLVVTFAALSTGYIPPNFRRCNRRDPEFTKCNEEAAQHGISLLTKPYKALDLPNLEPLEVPSLTVLGRGGAVAFDQNFKNCTIHGMTKIKFEKYDLDLEKILDLVAVIPDLVLQCQYQLNGKVLLLPIEGEGNSKIDFKNYRVRFYAVFDVAVRGSGSHLTTTGSEITTESEHVHFQFDNLFNGTKSLGDNINQVLNDNWKEIYDEVKVDYDELVRRILTELMERLWTKLSLEELFD